ncbi:hypothetical protein ACFWPQ_45940 [Streptomyces sp. NPDC058464]|uniref:hypothetical protein n=1 Tax=Streptomyces sp. NPDC058464 TaxID=3346511 RepID=UPI0036591A23
MGCDPVLVRRAGGVLRITPGRPGRRSAHGAQWRDAVVAAVDIAVRGGAVRQVILDGNGFCFSSGGVLDEFGTSRDLAAAHLIRIRAGAAARLHALGRRLTARIRGGAVRCRKAGAGMAGVSMSRARLAVASVMACVWSVCGAMLRSRLAGRRVQLS